MYLEYNIDVFSSDSAGKIARTESVLLGADIGGFDMILGHLWLKTVTPIVDWANDHWTHLQVHDLSKKVDLALLNASEFEAKCSMEGTLAFTVAISDILKMDNKAQARPVPTIPAEYLDLAEVFSENGANTLPNHGPQYLSLETNKAQPFGPFYNLSQVEQEVLRGYIFDNLAKDFI